MATDKYAQLALHKVEAKLSKHPNVVGLGVVSASENPADSKAALGVYVKKIYKGKVKTAGKLPPTIQVGTGARKVAVPVKFIEQGEVRLESIERL